MGVLFDSYQHCGRITPDRFVQFATVHKPTNGKNRFAPAQRKLCTGLVQAWDSLSQVFIDSSGFYLVAFFCALTGFSQARGLTFLEALDGLQCNEYAENVRNRKQSPICLSDGLLYRWSDERVDQINTKHITNWI